MKTWKILGIDLSPTGTAWVVIRDPSLKLLDYGFQWEHGAKSGIERDLRLTGRGIAAQLAPLMDTVDMVGVEAPIFGINRRGALNQAWLLGYLRGLLEEAAPHSHLKTFEINPMHTKKALGLSGKANKKEVVANVEERLFNDEQFHRLCTDESQKDLRLKIEAVCDAIGVARATRILYTD